MRHVSASEQKKNRTNIRNVHWIIELVYIKKEQIYYCDSNWI